MIKIIKLSHHIRGVRFASTRRYQFKVVQPVYYPKRDLAKEDELKIPLQVQEQKPSPFLTNTLMPSFEFYKILGVKKTATAQEIKAAYYNLAKKFHPDASQTKQETRKFQKISEAYQILNDEITRTEYDRYGKVRICKTNPNVIPLGDESPASAKKRTIKPISETYKVVNDEPNQSNRSGQHQRVRSCEPSRKTKPLADEHSHIDKKKSTFLRVLKEDISPQKEVKVALKDIPHMSSKNEIELDLKFLQAVNGTKEYIDLKAMIKCPKCNGTTRLNNQANIEFCQKCGGTGQYRTKLDTDILYQECDNCQGKRYINKNTCKTCDNRGFVVKTRRVEVYVPPGSATGDILKVPNPLTKQMVNVRLNVDKSSYFKREGNNINTDKYITISQAVLGGKFKIRGLYEELEVVLGPGIQSHTTYCFFGKGIMTKAAETGDHIVTFKIRIPKSLTTKQRQLILALSKAEDPTFDGQ